MIAAFFGGPLDGAAERLPWCPDRLVFSSARILGEWETGALTVGDVVYERCAVLTCPVRYDHRPAVHQP